MNSEFFRIIASMIMRYVRKRILAVSPTAYLPLHDHQRSGPTTVNISIMQILLHDPASSRAHNERCVINQKLRLSWPRRTMKCGRLRDVQCRPSHTELPHS
jgi:hypothetical protein